MNDSHDISQGCFCYASLKSMPEIMKQVLYVRLVNEHIRIKSTKALGIWFGP